VNKLKQYGIQFSGLKEGKHDFEFEIGKDLFDAFDNSEILDADIVIRVNFEKHTSNLSLEFDIQGIIQTTCDRCLDPIDLEIDYSPKLYVNFGDETSDLTDVDDTMILARTEDTLELAKHFYDYICLNIPIQKYHPDNEDGSTTCNAEMIKKLQNYMSDNEENGKIDPRWEKLRNIYN
jgi:uncharacterized protein